MSTFAVILIVLAVLLGLLFLGGLAANARGRRANEARLQRRVEAADQALAAARAEDRGWDPEAMSAAARASYAGRNGGREPDALHLVQVVDMPGTDEDEAVFRAVAGDHEENVLLGREGGRWVAR